MSRTQRPQQSYLALDVGLKRTGVAVGQRRLKRASTAGQLKIKHGRFDIQEFDRLIDKWAPDVIIIGNPMSTDPHLNKVINRLKSHIQVNHKIEIIDFDETLSSNAANAELEGSGFNIKQKTELRDQIAACLILESYFSTLP